MTPPASASPLDLGLSEEEMVRYSRQIVLREVGGSGQRRLSRASVAVVGAGGLGSPALLYLAAAGVGRIAVLDPDRVSLDNLQRQVLYGDADVGAAKAEAAARRLRALNPGVRVDALELALDAGGAAAALAGYDAVLEGSDSLACKFAVNDACVALGITGVIGGVLRFEGQVLVVPPGAPCYRCLFGGEPRGAPPPTCSSAGILGPVAGVVGSLMATEVLRQLVAAGGAQGGRLLVFDGLRGRLREVTFAHDPACTACARRRAR